MPTDSILITIKEALGVGESDRSFDSELIMHINSTFTTLTQLAVGPPEGYMITDSENKWVEFLEHEVRLNAVQGYIYTCVKLVFDSPDNYYTVKTLEEQKAQWEFRLNVIAEEIALEILAELNAQNEL